MSNDWVQQKENWRRTVAARFHEWAVLAVATELDSYFNAETKDAWPKTETLAHNLGTDRRLVQRALDKLVEAGLLGCRMGGRGPRDPNRYWMKGGRETAHSKNKGGPEIPKGRSGDPEKGGPETARYGEVTLEEPERAAASAAASAADAAALSAPRSLRPSRRRQDTTSEAKRSSRKGAFTSPAEWTPGQAELEDAQELCPHWSQEYIADQFEQMRDWYRARNKRSANVEATWRSWCRRGKDRDTNNRSRRDQQDDSMVEAANAFVLRAARQYVRLGERDDDL